MAGSLSPRSLSEAQMEIMTVVWDRGETTVADVWSARRCRRTEASRAGRSNGWPGTRPAYVGAPLAIL